MHESLSRRLRAWTVAFDRNHPLKANISDLLRDRPIAYYIGWLNHNNYGDTVLALAFKYYFDNLIPFQAYPRKSIEGKFSHFLRPTAPQISVLGGGTLIGGPYLTAIEEHLDEGRKYFTFGTGCSDKHPDNDVRTRWENCLNRTSHLYVRGKKSVELCKNLYGVEHAVAVGDPALVTASIFPPHPTPLNQGMIGFNLGSHKFERNEKTYKIGIKIIQALAKLGHSFALVSMHKIDDRITLDAFNEAGIIPKTILSPHKNWADISQLASLTAIVCERLHAAILAHAYGVPAIALKYDEKLTDHFNMIEEENLLMDVQDPKFNIPYDLIEDVSKAPQQHSDRIKLNRDTILKKQCQVFEDLRKQHAT